MTMMVSRTDTAFFMWRDCVLYFWWTLVNRMNTTFSVFVDDISYCGSYKVQGLLHAHSTAELCHFANRIAKIAKKLKMHTMGRNVCNYDLILVGRDTGAQDGTFVRHKCGHISFWLERFIWFWCDICFSHCRWLNQNRRTNSMKSRQKYCSTVQWISNGLTLHTMPSDIDG